MRLTNLKMQNFRGYRDEISVDFDDLTVFVGKNDIGKSTILEALDIFFNDSKGVIKFEPADINNLALDGDETSITVRFDQLPANITIDTTYQTTLADEYLLTDDGYLEVKKVYKTATTKTYIRALHPTNPICNDLLLKKNAELKRIVRENNIECANQAINSELRKAIWHHYEVELQLAMVDIDVTKGETKPIWNNLENYLPTYSLFQADRKNTDNDTEVQDPLKVAVKEILQDEALRASLETIADQVETKLREVSARTLEKLREMSPEIADSLNPDIPPVENLKWADVFKNVSITGDDNIPINKRGSGVKRLILLNFFRAEAERRQAENRATGIIYAIEEPETSQHTANQKKLITALKELAEAENTQVFLTTHSANIVKALAFPSLRLVFEEGNRKNVTAVTPAQLPYPSLNEVNYLAFTEVSEEYHDELYGHLKYCGLYTAYCEGKPQRLYTKMMNGEPLQPRMIPLTEYIRHKIHHPENHFNDDYTAEDLQLSILDMREFIEQNTPLND